MTGLQKRISKLLTPLKSRRSGTTKDGSDVVRTLTIVCTPDHSTEDVLAQLQDVSQNKHVTCVVLKEMIQRPDNVQLFSRIQDLLRESKYFSNVQSIHLVEPHVHSVEYRRWCFKKTNFLMRVRKGAKERHIDITIHGTLILDAADFSSSDGQDTAQEQQQQLSQNVSGWLSLLQQLPQDPDITSLWISLREEPLVHIVKDTGRPSQLDLQRSPVQMVFSALVELFNADTRRWKFINCHVLYHPDTDSNKRVYQLQEQTESLLEVAELFHIPLQVQWQPVTQTGSSVARIRTRTTSLVAQRGLMATNDNDKTLFEDDNTSTTIGMEGSSGAFTALQPATTG